MQLNDTSNILSELYAQICEGKISYASAASKLNCSIYKLKQYLIQSGFEVIEKKAGRPAIEPTEEQIELTTQYTDIFRVGYKRCAESLKKRGIHISQNTVHKIYDNQSLFLHEPRKKKSKHIHRYFAYYKDQQWNTDLHEITITIGTQKVDAYLIAFLDDATRYVIHAEIFPRKTAFNAAGALQKALNKCEERPHILHSDNGMEFWGDDFQNVLKAYSIEFTTTTPYTPQENGKIERWWQTFDMSLISINNLNLLVDEYNNFWNHSSLEARFGRKTTPSEARNLLQSWIGKYNLQYIYTK